jgi:hypothetical protein
VHDHHDTDGFFIVHHGVAVQVHSIDRPHVWILPSIELISQHVASALGWQPRRDRPKRPEAKNVT